jgi:hypothetical protein
MGEMVPKFLASKPAPLGFIALDLDFYSWTMQGMRVFEAYEDSLLPRVYCAFDDIFACEDFNGERLAISDLNTEHKHDKISKIYGYGLQYFLPNGVAQQRM